jgi:hypothetical protein
MRKSEVGRTRWLTPVVAAVLSLQPALADEMAVVDAPHNELNLRDGPNAEADIRSVLTNGMRVRIIETLSNGWQKVIVDNPSQVGSTKNDQLVGFVNGRYLTNMSAMTTTAFGDGHADRKAFESWFDQLSGVYRAGAEFWAGHRSDPSPPDCVSTTDVAFRSGCEDARTKLDPADRRRRAEPDYKAGWNAPLDFDPETVGRVSAEGTMPSAEASGEPVASANFGAPWALARSLIAPPAARTNEPIATAGSTTTRDVLVCPQPGTVHPYIVTLDLTRKMAQVKWQSNTTSTECVYQWSDGAVAPVARGPTAALCTIFANNSPARQTVRVDGPEVTVSDTNGGGFRLNLTTGLMRNKNGTEECHRPHGG